MPLRRLQPDRITVLIFLAVIFLPLVGGLLRLDSPGSLQEKRKLAPRPHLFTQTGMNRDFPQQFKDYYNDHFAFRGFFIRGFSLLALILQDSPSQKVLLGRDGWLFYTGNRSVESYRGLRPHTKEELEAFRSNLLQRQEAISREGAAYLYVIAPNKSSIYPEFLPGQINRVSDKTRLDLLVESLKEDPSLHVLDLRPVLTRAKERFRIYHHTDTHWNEIGAWIAVREVLKTLNDLYPDRKPFVLKNIASLTQESEETPGGDLAQFMGLEATLREKRLRFAAEEPRCKHRKVPDYLGLEWPIPAIQPVEWTCPAGSRTLMMTLDSFGMGMMHMLSRHFGKSLFLCASPSIEFPLSDLEAFVRHERPSVVIEEHAERLL